VSPLWILPLVVVSIGAALLAVVVRPLAAAAADLVGRGADLSALGRQAVALRVEVDSVATRARGLSWRSDADAGDR